MRINTNIEALNAQRNLTATAGAFAKSVEKLSSGLRINRAADDAAGLAISERLKAQVVGLNQAQRNAQDGISMVQTAEGSLGEVHSMLHRIRELAVEAANSTLQGSDLTSVATEVSALRAEIDRIANSSTFNSQHLLDGSLGITQAATSTAAAGAVVDAGTNTSITAVNVTGAKPAATYTLTSTATGITLTSSLAGNPSQSILDANLGVAANGSRVLIFDTLGVSITIASVAGASAAQVKAGLAASGASAGVPTPGGASGTDLVNTDVLTNTNTAPVTAGGGVTYSSFFSHPHGLDGATPLTATASPGVAQGTLSMSADLATGHMTGSVGGENFSGFVPAAVSGAPGSFVLTGDRGNTITLNYLQAPTGANIADEAFDISGATFAFVAGPGSAQVSALSATGIAVAGTYTFSSAAPNSLTLTRSGGGTETITVNDMAANGVQPLNFATLGVSFTLTANGDPGGFSAASAISDLLQGQNDTIVINAVGASGGSGLHVDTSAGSGAQFQVGANNGEAIGVTFTDNRVSAQLNAAIAAFTGLTSVTTAGALITSVDTEIASVSTQRGNLGAVQNRLEHTTASISIASENLNASMSRIRDLDVASEMVSFTKTQILQQAGTAILAQANSAPQNLLTLLR